MNRAYNQITPGMTAAGFSSAPVVEAPAERVFSLSTLEQAWRAALNRKWAVVAIVAGCILVGLLATLLATPRYTATARVEISRQQANVTDVQTVENTDQMPESEFYATQYSLLQSRSLAERVARAMNLASNDEFFEAFGSTDELDGVVSGPVGPTDGAQARAARLQRAVDILLDNISVAPIRDSSLVDISFTSPDRRLSADVANAWVEQFIAAKLGRRFASTQDARKFLEQQLDALRKRLEDSERQLVTYASEKQIVQLARENGQGDTTASDQTLVGADLQAMNAQLAQARADRIAAESEAAREGGDDLGNVALNGLRQRRALVAAERANLLTTFEPDYPHIQALTSELGELDRSIAREESRIRSASNSDYSAAVLRERELVERVEALKDRFVDQNRDSIQYNIYQREVDTNRELYNGLLQRYKEIGVAGVGFNNVAIVDAARVPDHPSSPSLVLNLAIAIVLGLILAAMYVFIRENTDRSLRDPADVQSLFGLAHLGTVPNLVKEEVLESLRDPKSPAAEAYFSIATNLSFLTDHGVPGSILFTSTQPNEGKSTSAFAVAAMLARMGKSTLLVDADLRNPSIHEMFGMDHRQGLSNFLSGEDDIAMLVQKADQSGLAIMSAGPIPPAPAELLSGNRMRTLLQALKGQFDHVIFDGPPVLGIADAPLLAREVEGVIYTIEANNARLRAVEVALQRLRTANSHLFGAIVTKVDARNASYGYGYEYGYGYSYGDSRSAAESA